MHADPSPPLMLEFTLPRQDQPDRVWRAWGSMHECLNVPRGVQGFKIGGLNLRNLLKLLEICNKS